MLVLIELADHDLIRACDYYVLIGLITTITLKSCICSEVAMKNCILYFRTKTLWFLTSYFNELNSYI